VSFVSIEIGVYLTVITQSLNLHLAMASMHIISKVVCA
jgi:hypothetical protein